MNNVIIGVGELAWRGVYAARNFRKGEVVIKYHLRLLSKNEYENLTSKEKMFVHSHHGMLYLYSEPERYVNHSRNPNTSQDIDCQCDIATQDILKGEKITTDAKKDDV